MESHDVTARLRRLWRLYLWHQIADLLRIVGLRDRLRCPKCRAVGTWKPHGGWLDARESRFRRRWMCKWCGYHFNSDGEAKVFPSAAQGCWMTVGSLPQYDPTPQEILEPHKINPWFG